MFFIASSVSPYSTTRFVARIEGPPLAVPQSGISASSCGQTVPDFAEFIIGPASGRPQWLHPGYSRPLAADHGGDREQPLFAGPLALVIVEELE